VFSQKCCGGFCCLSSAYVHFVMSACTGVQCSLDVVFLSLVGGGVLCSCLLSALGPSLVVLVSPFSLPFVVGLLFAFVHFPAADDICWAFYVCC
jgi:hypothetical protein